MDNYHENADAPASTSALNASEAIRTDHPVPSPEAEDTTTAVADSPSTEKTTVEGGGSPPDHDDAPLSGEAPTLGTNREGSEAPPPDGKRQDHQEPTGLDETASIIHDEQFWGIVAEVDDACQKVEQGNEAASLTKREYPVRLVGSMYLKGARLLARLDLLNKLLEKRGVSTGPSAPGDENAGNPFLPIVKAFIPEKERTRSNAPNVTRYANAVWGLHLSGEKWETVDDIVEWCGKKRLERPKALAAAERKKRKREEPTDAPSVIQKPEQIEGHSKPAIDTIQPQQPPLQGANQTEENAKVPIVTIKPKVAKQHGLTSKHLYVRMSLMEDGSYELDLIAGSLSKLRQPT